MSDPVVALLRHAAADGHTWLPAWLVASALRGAGAPSAAAAAAMESGAVLAVDVDASADRTPAGGLALADIAEAEELLADGVAALVAEGRLACVTGPAGGARAAACGRCTAEAEASGADVVLLDDAERLPLHEAVAVVEDLPEDALLLLAGDLDLPWSPGPGAVFHDVVTASGAPVVPAAGVSDRPAALARLETGIRGGTLLPLDPADRTVVVVPVTDDADAVRRTTQLVTTSIPRTFDRHGDEIGVLTLAARGATAPGPLAEAITAALAGAQPGGAQPDVAHLVDVAGRRWPAVVLVLAGSAAGALSRDLVLAGLAAGTEHVSVVHGCGPALASAVADVPRRPRRTRLAGLLADLAGGRPGTMT